MNNELRQEVLRTKLLPAFVESTRQAFETMVFLPTVASAPLFDPEEMPRGDISGSIGVTGSIALTGDNLRGNLSLIFPDGMATNLFRAMTMMGPDDPVNPQEVIDAVGELANMCAGGAKAGMQEIGLNFMISLPSVVSGSQHSLARMAGCSTCLVPMRNDQGEFHMEISFQWK
jgi:chemotaxis protein CheX